MCKYSLDRCFSQEMSCKRSRSVLVCTWTHGPWFRTFLGLSSPGKQTNVQGWLLLLQVRFPVSLTKFSRGKHRTTAPKTAQSSIIHWPPTLFGTTRCTVTPLYKTTMVHVEKFKTVTFPHICILIYIIWRITELKSCTSLAAAAIGVGWLAMSPMEMASLRSFWMCFK